MNLQKNTMERMDDFKKFLMQITTQVHVQIDISLVISG